MKTKLEAIAGYLAGREDGSAPLRAELDDPSSEASRFLDSTRARSRALLAGLTAPSAGVAPGPTPKSSHKGRAALGVLACLVAVAAPLWVGEVRARRLEARLERDRAASEADARALEARLLKALEALKPPPVPEPPSSREPAIEAALGRLESALERYGKRLDGLARSGSAPAPASAPTASPRTDTALADIRAELVLIRREAAANELAGGRQFQELRTIVQELNEVLRRVIGLPQPLRNGIPR